MKLYLAHCEKTGKHFCLEARERCGRIEIINFLDITDADAAEIPFATPTAALYTATNLLPCRKCGSRKISGCSCVKTRNCKYTDGFKLACAYCDKLVVDKPVPKLPRILVTAPGSDNIGKVLDAMGLNYKPFNGSYDCDVLFINCLTSSVIDINKLRSFVQSGGCVYLSDLASSFLGAAFPGVITYVNTGDSRKIYARVVDSELRQIAGERIKIEFDLVSWSVITGTPMLSKLGGKVLLTADEQPYSGTPIMITFNYGEGRVFYTSFHNHAQASEKETMLLQLLLLKQLASGTDKSVEEVGELIGLNISSMKEKFKR